MEDYWASMHEEGRRKTSNHKAEEHRQTSNTKLSKAYKNTL